MSENRFRRATGKDAVAALRRRILNEGDAVIQNVRAGTLARRGLSAECFAEEKPELIWCDIGAFGPVGPLAERPGYDPLIQASTGLMSVTGEGGRPPVRVGVSIMDMGAGMWAVIGLLAALLNRAKTGQGGRVGTSLYETGLAWMTVHLAGFGASGEVRRPHGSGLAEIVPYQAFETRNGWLMIAAGNDGLFQRLCAMIERPDLASAPHLTTNARRVEHRAELVPAIAAFARTQTLEALGARLDAAGVPNAPVQTVDAVVAHNQTRATGMLAPAEGDTLPLAGIPVRLGGARPRSRAAAPRLEPQRGSSETPLTGGGTSRAL